MVATMPSPAQWRPLLKALRLPCDAVRKIVLIVSPDEPVRVLADCYVGHDRLDAALDAFIDIARECEAIQGADHVVVEPVYQHDAHAT